MAKSDFHKVANYGDATEAEFICSILQENDLAAFVDGAAASSWMPHVGSALGGVGLYVKREDAERALEIIESLDSGYSEDSTPWFCEPCQAEVEGSFEVCWSCGRPRGEVEGKFPDTANIVSPNRPDVENLESRIESEHSNPYAAPRTEAQGETLEPRTAEPGFNEDAERMLVHAFRASIIGLICLPVIAHFYSMYLLMRASLVGAKFSAKGRSRFAWAVVINIASVFAWGYLFSR